MRKWTQIAILMFALLSLFLSFELSNPTFAWWQSVLQNFGAGLFSALIVIWLYDRVLEREAEKAKNERNRIVASQLVPLFRSHIYGFLFPMYRSAVAVKPAKSIVDWKEFLTDSFPREMPNLDISARSPGSFPEITPYPKFISNNLQSFSNRVQSWLGKYGSMVDADLFDACEQVINSNFSVFGSSLEHTANFMPPSFPPSYSFTAIFKFDIEMCRDYGLKLISLIETIEGKLPNRISKFEEQYWHNACLDIGYARQAGSSSH
jgi:hypothetical protein